MKSDFDVIVRKFDEDKPIFVYPIADIHLGALEHNEAEWDAFVKQIQSEENSYLILAGDLINNNTRSSVGSPWDDLIRPREQKRKMVEYLSPLRDRILCCVSGNHERRSMKDADDDPTYDIMAKLDIEDVYRLNAAFLKLRVSARSGGLYRDTYMFAVTHGAGGGIYTGATVNRNERWGNTIEGIDCIISGHTHKGTVTRPSKIVFDSKNDVVSVKSYLSVTCESWQSYGGYAIQKMLLPAETARPICLELSNIHQKKEIITRW